MARMSIDDMFLRDPRVARLAHALGWSKYEARGRLLDVFAVVYDRVDAGGSVVVSRIDVDVAADFPGLCDRMVEFDLAVNVRDGVLIRGSKERTKYLATREESGRRGGLKSGESRRNKSKVTFKQEPKVTFAETEGQLNPSASASASAPDPTQISDPALPARAIPPYQAKSGRAEAWWKRFGEARIAIAAELGMPEPLPFAAIGPSSQPRGFRDLLDRIREEGDNAEPALSYVLEVLIAQARDTRCIDWLGEKSFSDGVWRTAKESIPGWRAKRASSSALDVADAAFDRIKTMEAS